MISTVSAEAFDKKIQTHKLKKTAIPCGRILHLLTFLHTFINNQQSTINIL